MKLKVTMQVNQMPFCPFFASGLLAWVFLVLLGGRVVFAAVNLTGGEYGKVVMTCSAFLIFPTA